MSDNQELLLQLQNLLTQKRSRSFYADRLGVPVSKIDELMLFIRKGADLVEEAPAVQAHIEMLEDQVLKFEEDIKNRTAEATYRLDTEIHSLDELIEKCKIDISIWKIDKYIQNYWGNSAHPHWQVKAFLSKVGAKEEFQQNFIDFLGSYIPFAKDWDPGPPPTNPSLPNACLVVNKQDQHLNKYDIGGDNDINERFEKSYRKLKIVLEQAKLSNNLDYIHYVIGSDEFNSEWTGLTTKGTPQENAIDYHTAFKTICSHEVDMIDMITRYSPRVKITYVAGNHDEYVGWHLINWLKACYGILSGIEFDDSPKYRKYIKYGKTAMMFNHGDVIKPAKLSNMFPIEFREQWSECENYYIFTGDKHHEIALDFNGIKFYQLPALSNSRSKWDDKHGHITKGELTAFVIDKHKGMTSILKQPL